MVKLMTGFFVFLGFSVSVMSQGISISTSKLKYKLMDSIQIKLINKSTTDLYFAIGEEEYFNNKWLEFEPMVNEIGKTERIEKIRKSAFKIIKVRLPQYLKSTIQKEGPLKIRFHAKSGIDYHDMQINYSDPILIILK